EAEDASVFSIGPMIVGSLVVALIAMVFAVPLSVGGALYIEFYAPKGIYRVLVTLLDLAAAVPSLIFGLWGIQIFTPIGVRWATLLNDRLGFIPIFSVEFENLRGVLSWQAVYLQLWSSRLQLLLPVKFILALHEI
ncbi:MAG: hypothetical protein JZU67_03215, partial [Burkholderiaceae bacterium]|nr:hypothetical protein [Burkholderiaceae bacterium]